MNTNTSKAKNTLRLLPSGDPRTQFHHASAAQILAESHPPRRLLSTSAKLDKCESVGVLARVLYLTPGVFCPAATDGCRRACLGHTSGRMQFLTHAVARDARTALYLDDPELFIKRLRAELTLLETDALQYRMQPAVRLNGSSDLRWERLHPQLFSDFPDLQFFDYTKLTIRISRFLLGELPSNYHLTLSVDAHMRKQATDILQRDGTVAAVFWPELPKTWWNFPVIDGDRHDARFLDPAGVIVGLRAKGLARVDTTGFTIRPCQGCGPKAPALELERVLEDTHRRTFHRCPKCKLTLSSSWKLHRPITVQHSAA